MPIHTPCQLFAFVTKWVETESSSRPQPLKGVRPRLPAIQLRRPARRTSTAHHCRGRGRRRRTAVGEGQVREWHAPGSTRLSCRAHFSLRTWLALSGCSVHAYLNAVLGGHCHGGQSLAALCLRRLCAEAVCRAWWRALLGLPFDSLVLGTPNATVNTQGAVERLQWAVVARPAAECVTVCNSAEQTRLALHSLSYPVSRAAPAVVQHPTPITHTLWHLKRSPQQVWSGRITGAGWTGGVPPRKLGRALLSLPRPPTARFSPSSAWS